MSWKVIMMTRIQIKGDIIDDETAELYEWFGITNYTNPKKVVEALEKAGSNTVTIEINSLGGYLTAASEIYTALKNHKAGVVGEITGIAASAASIIAMAAKPLKIAPVAQIMIHNASVDSSGNKFDMIKNAEILDSFDQSQINAYEYKTGKSREELEVLLNETTYLDAKRAVELGFADEIMFSENLAVTANADISFTKEIVAKMKSLKATATLKENIDLDKLASLIAGKLGENKVETPEEPKENTSILENLLKNL